MNRFPLFVRAWLINILATAVPLAIIGLIGLIRGSGGWTWDFTLALGLFVFLYAPFVSGLGWVVGSLINGALVYPKNARRNYKKSYWWTGSIIYAFILGLFLSRYFPGSHPYRDHNHTFAENMDDRYGGDTSQVHFFKRSLGALEEKYPDFDDFRVDNVEFYRKGNGAVFYYWYMKKEGDSALKSLHINMDSLRK